MKYWIGNLKFRLLLLVTLQLIRRAQVRHARVRELLQRERHVFQLQTVGGLSGHFVVGEGRITLRFGPHPQPDFTQVWRDGHAAFRALTSTDETDILRAFEGGECAMRGRFLVALWFNEVMKFARPGARPA